MNCEVCDQVKSKIIKFKIYLLVTSQNSISLKLDIRDWKQFKFYKICLYNFKVLINLIYKSEILKM